MSRDPLAEGWRYYGCARWGCDAVNPDYQSYGTKDGRSWCLHHKPGPIRRLLMGTTFPTPRSGRAPEALLPVRIVQRHYVLMREAAESVSDEMVERAAEALAREAGEEFLFAPDADFPGQAQYDAVARTGYRESARRALAAALVKAKA